MSISRGQKQRGISNSEVLDNLRCLGSLQVPLIDISNPPPPLTATSNGGGLAYDPVTKIPYYSDGLSWLPLVTSVPPGNVATYSFISSNITPVPPNTDVVLTNWTILPSTVYHTLPEWGNPPTGIFTASTDMFLQITVNVSWSIGNNSGLRTLRIDYDDGGGFVPVKQADTQPDATTGVETTQECSISLQLQAGDVIRIVVRSTSSSLTSMSSGIQTSVSGFVTS